MNGKNCRLYKTNQTNASTKKKSWGNFKNNFKGKRKKEKKLNWEECSPWKTEVKEYPKSPIKKHRKMIKKTTKKTHNSSLSAKNQIGSKERLKIAAKNTKVFTVLQFTIPSWIDLDFNANKNYSFIYVSAWNKCETFPPFNFLKKRETWLVKMCMITVEEWHSKSISRCWRFWIKMIVSRSADSIKLNGILYSIT